MAKESTANIVTVQGKGDFPMDMLRYDGAIPHREEDSYAITTFGLRKVSVGRWTG